ncbi:hypothetical protein [Mycoplasmopsis canis]|uniref:hypothetical protein n=1 Tax=Mycoplasmopsis canis TaxID=29555 RepID=UPI0005C7050C|nr:hypothetical protein [Mycoplasmopsis canis]
MMRKIKNLLLLTSLVTSLSIVSCSPSNTQTSNKVDDNSDNKDNKTKNTKEFEKEPKETNIQDPVNKKDIEKEDSKPQVPIEVTKKPNDKNSTNKEGANSENNQIPGTSGEDKKEKEIPDSEEYKENNNEIFEFQDPVTLSNDTQLTSQGNVSDPKRIFDKTDFPENVVLENSNNNKIIVERYFENELVKVIKTGFIGGFPQDSLPIWYTKNDFLNLPRYFFRNVPDLQVRFKDNQNFIKYVRKIMPIDMVDNEITKENENTIVIKKDLTNFTKHNFTQKKLSFNIRISSRYDSQNQIQEYELLRVNIDLENINNQFTNITGSPFAAQFKTELNQNVLTTKIKFTNKNITFEANDINNNIYVDKYNTLTDISYYVNEGQDKNFPLGFDNLKNSVFPKISSNNELNKTLKYSERLNPTNNKENIFKDIRKRVFVVGGGTSTMLSKVKPSDDNDFRYYFITNRHVTDILETRWNDNRVLKKIIIPDFDDNKVSTANSDISINVEKSFFEFNFWESKNQTSRKGILLNDGRQNADISISIIDIKPILDLATSTNNTKIKEYFENWKELKSLKLSKTTKYIDSNSIVNLSLASFPQDSHAGFSGRRYREHIINRIEEITLSDQAPEFAKYGYFRTFVQSDRNANIQLDLISGGSGSVVYDKNGDIVALFMQNIGDDQYGFGLLASHKYDYFGYETNNNPNSFKNKLSETIKQNPNKFEMINF